MFLTASAFFIIISDDDDKKHVTQFCVNDPVENAIKEWKGTACSHFLVLKHFSG